MGFLNESGSAGICFGLANCVGQIEGDYSAIVPAYPYYDSFAMHPVTLAAAPLPSTLPLFGTVLGLGGLLGWHRKRKVSAAIAA